MRIISGKYRGRRLLDTTNLKELRPTTDYNRENLFNILINRYDIDLTKCDLLDVFAGTGAISLEALSRGAKSATLIDKNPQHLEIAQKNAELLREKNLEYYKIDLRKKLPQAKRPFNLIFIDPPYSKNLVIGAIENLIKSNWIVQNALIIIEHSPEEDFEQIDKLFKKLEEKKYGKTIFSFLRNKTCF